MRLEALELHNFRRYADTSLDLTGIRLASVVGPNGAGKSSLIDAVLFGLYGKSGVSLKLDEYVRRGQEEARVVVTFRVADGRFRVTRTRSIRGSGKTTADLSRWTDDRWTAEGTGADDTEARIEQLIGVDADLLRLSSVVEQSDAGSFFRLQPAKRLEAFNEILRLDERFGPIEQHFKAEAETHKLTLAEIRREVERLEADEIALEQKRSELGTLRDNKTTRDRAVTYAEEDLARAREQAEAGAGSAATVERLEQKIAGLRQQRHAAAETLMRYETRLNGLRSQIRDKRVLEEELKTRPALEEQIAGLEHDREADAELSRQRTMLESDLTIARGKLEETSRTGKPKRDRVTALEAKRADLEARISGIEEAEVPICDRCRQPIGGDAREHTLDSLREERRPISLEIVELQNELEVLRGTFAEQDEQVKAVAASIAALPSPVFDSRLYSDRLFKRDKLAEIPGKLAAIVSFEEQITATEKERDEYAAGWDDEANGREIVTAENELAQASDFAKEWARRGGEVRAREQSLADARALAGAADREAARAEEAVSILAGRVDTLAGWRVKDRDTSVALADAELLRKHFSKWGVPALIVGNVLRQLEREVNELLSLYDGGFAIRFESEKETRDGMRDSLEIMVFDGETWASFETYSGGEKFRIASAMRLGLALLLAHRSGARVETLIVDEPEGLDVAGRAHLVKILEHLSGHFGLVLAISHYDDLKEALPSQIIVERDGDNLSRVSVAA